MADVVFNIVWLKKNEGRGLPFDYYLYFSIFKILYLL